MDVATHSEHNRCLEGVTLVQSRVSRYCELKLLATRQQGGVRLLLSASVPGLTGRVSDVEGRGGGGLDDESPNGVCAEGAERWLASGAWG